MHIFRQSSVSLPLISDDHYSAIVAAVASNDDGDTDESDDDDNIMNTTIVALYIIAIGLFVYSGWSETAKEMLL